MAMGTRKKRQRQENLWYGGELPVAPGHPFYQRLNDVLRLIFTACHPVLAVEGRVALTLRLVVLLGHKRTF